MSFSKKDKKTRSHKMLPEEWAVKRDRKMSEEEWREYQKIENEDASLFNEIESSHRFLDFLDHHSETIEGIIAQKDASKKHSAFWQKSPQLAFAAALLIGCAFIGAMVWSWVDTAAPVNVVKTESSSEPLAHILPDSSLIQLNSDTEVSYNFQDTVRELTLHYGEAHFEISHDPQRPFIVNVGEVEVEAIGTAFNIRVDEDTVHLLVTEGTVEVRNDANEVSTEYESTTLFANQRLQKGQSAEISKSDTDDTSISILKANTIEVENALIWRESLFSFGGDTLESIAEVFQQRTGYTLLIKDPVLLKTKIGGSYPSSNPFGFLNILKNNFGISWYLEDETTIILEK